MFPDPNDLNEPDENSRFKLATFENARVEDFLLKPQVYTIDEALAQTLATLLLQYDRYWVETTFSETTAPQPNPPVHFDLIEVKADIVARMQAELEI